MSIDTESVFGKTGQICQRSGRYVLKKNPDIGRAINAGEEFPPYQGAVVIWVFDGAGHNPDPDPDLG